MCPPLDVPRAPPRSSTDSSAMPCPRIAVLSKAVLVAGLRGPGFSDRYEGEFAARCHRSPGVFIGAQPLESSVRMVLIVVPSKRIDLLRRVLKRREPVHVQTLLSEPPVERFDRGIVGRLSPTTEIQDDLVRIRPEIHRRADKFGAVVAVDPLRQSTRKTEPLEGGRDVLAAESLPDIDRQAF